MRALDNLTAQVHEGGARPDYLSPEVELAVGDVRDAEAVSRALDGVDAVVHLAARVGVGQSMYELAEYTGTNELGTAVLCEALIERPVRQAPRRLQHERLRRGITARRALARAARARRVGAARRRSTPLPTPETKQPELASVYALSKFQQERLCLLFGSAYGVPTVALRLFNTYGPRQALSNPYTGVLAIFAARLLNGRPPLIFEDGLQRRDFVSVHDVAAAFALALDSPAADGRVLNVGSGSSVTVLELAERLAAVMGVDVAPRGDRALPRRRHPPLLRGHHARPRAARLRAAGRARAGHGRARRVARGPRRDRPRRRRRRRTLLPRSHHLESPGCGTGRASS